MTEIPELPSYTCPLIDAVVEFLEQIRQANSDLRERQNHDVQVECLQDEIRTLL